LKKWISFLVDIIHVKDKSPENEAFILFLVIQWSYISISPHITILSSGS